MGADLLLVEGDPTARINEYRTTVKIPRRNCDRSRHTLIFTKSSTLFAHL
jgi:hypothetical protein